MTFPSAKNLVWLIGLLVLFQGGCGYEECRTNERFAREPGICGKIYRTQKSKQVFKEKAKIIIVVILGITGLPLFVKFQFNLIKRTLQFISRILFRFFRT